MPAELPEIDCDVLVVGSGAAGLSQRSLPHGTA